MSENSQSKSTKEATKKSKRTVSRVAEENTPKRACVEKTTDAETRPFWNKHDAVQKLASLSEAVAAFMKGMILEEGSDISYTKTEETMRACERSRSNIILKLRELMLAIARMCPSVPEKEERDCDRLLALAMAELSQAEDAMSTKLEIDTGDLRLKTLDIIHRIEEKLSEEVVAELDEIKDSVAHTIEECFFDGVMDSQFRFSETARAMCTKVQLKLVRMPDIIDKLEKASRTAHPNSA